MIDLVCALAGRKYCGWCNYKPVNKFQRFMGADKYHSDHRSWYQHIYEWVGDLDFRLKVWELGRRWHFRVHEHRTDYER